MRIAFIPAVNMDVSAMPASTMVRREAPAYNDTKNTSNAEALSLIHIYRVGMRLAIQRANLKTVLVLAHNLTSAATSAAALVQIESNACLLYTSRCV